MTAVRSYRARNDVSGILPISATVLTVSLQLHVEAFVLAL
jgi:hypothetical protein